MGSFRRSPASPYIGDHGLVVSKLELHILILPGLAINEVGDQRRAGCQPSQWNTEDTRKVGFVVEQSNWKKAGSMILEIMTISSAI